jgi:4,5-DOPA dioxygenase extradiol
MRSARQHYEFGRRLAPLRDEGVLVLGSGNVVHNLRRMNWVPDAPPFDWATRFEAQACGLALAGDHDALIDYQRLGDDAALAVPTPEHYLPLLYVLSAGGSGTVQCPIEGIDGSSISMLAVQVD